MGGAPSGYGYEITRSVERSLDYGKTFEALADHPTGMTHASLVIVDNDTLFLSFGQEGSKYHSPQIDGIHETHIFNLS